MEKIKGTNLGNWLVLEEWMNPRFFEGTGASDEAWLNRKMDRAKLEPIMNEHRSTYITEADFKHIAERGLNLVRIPVPYFVFGDREPYIGCIEYLDQAFIWAQKAGLKVLVDLHTVKDSQNGYDNGGITGVCKWYKNKKEVVFALDVLRRLARRYADKEALYGIEVLNEPISWPVYITSPSRNKAVDKDEAKGSGYVPLNFLKQFYRKAYQVLRKELPDEKVIVFHDGFRLGAWKDFFVKNNMKNVVLDTHIYIFAMEGFVKIPSMLIYRYYIWWCRQKIKRAARYTPVLVGEWCIANRLGIRSQKRAGNNMSARTNVNRKIAKIQLDAWSTSAGWVYWNYQLHKNHIDPMEETWMEEWDLNRSLKHGWIPDLKK